jgi:hypothetical protein
MPTLGFETLHIVMLWSFFIVGLLTFLTGVGVMLNAIYSKETMVIANQTEKLVQKGLAEDVAGLVGNANNVLRTIADMTTTRGNMGVLLMIAGLLLLAAAFVLTPGTNPAAFFTICPN